MLLLFLLLTKQSQNAACNHHMPRLNRRAQEVVYHRLARRTFTSSGTAFGAPLGGRSHGARENVCGLVSGTSRGSAGSPMYLYPVVFGIWGKKCDDDGNELNRHHMTAVMRLSSPYFCLVIASRKSVQNNSEE